MRPHYRRAHHRLVWLIATLPLASCAGRPPAREVDDAVRQLRAEYLQLHPDGPFNGSIERGEIAPGMRFGDVLASWGIPDARERNGVPTREWWTYTLTDPWSRDWVRYDILFDDGSVLSWEITRNVASSHPIAEPRAAPRAPNALRSPGPPAGAQPKR